MDAAVTYEIALAQTFHESLKRLEPVQQAAVLDAIGKLQQGLGAVHLHALSAMKWVSFVVNRDAVRVICHREGATLLLVWADTHEGAYRWAERHAPQRYGNVVRLVKLAVEDASPSPVESDVAPPGPLSLIVDKVFRGIEVGARLAGVLRAVPDEDALLELSAVLPPALAEALLSLAADPDSADGVIGRYHDAKSGAEVSLAQAVKASVNAEQIWVAPPEHRALAAALAGDAASWRVFLHPSQKRLVSVKASGPFLVTGGPGTGKTVVALHRARFLVERLAATRERPVLVTTFSKVLARQLEDGLAMVCRDVPALLPATKVLTLTAAARAVLERAGQKRAVLVAEDIDAAWADALEHDVLRKGRRFYESERDDVALAQGIRTEEEYLRAPRAGRKERLDRAAKKRNWSVLAAFEDALAKRGGDDPGGLARRATELLRDGSVEPPFAAVVCDEVQDASAWELRLLAALAVPAGEKQPGADRLFLVGDGHQRLYQRPTSLRACGIEVRGRSARLRLNYRTTQGICAAALKLVDGVPLDALELEAGDADAGGYRSLRAGEPPHRHVFANADEEADFVASTIHETRERPFLVLSRTKTMLAALEARLKARGIAATVLGDAELMPAGDHVVLATLHRSKGLEAPRVVLAGMQESPLRFPGGSDEERALWERKERLLVYVGMTRARDWCAVTSYRA